MVGGRHPCVAAGSAAAGARFIRAALLRGERLTRRRRSLPLPSPQDFFVTLVAPCKTAACVVPGFTFVEGGPCAGHAVPTSAAPSRIAALQLPAALCPTHPSNCPADGSCYCYRTATAGDYTIPQSQSYDPVIAAVPVMALVALAAFLSLYLVR